MIYSFISDIISYIYFQQKGADFVAEGKKNLVVTIDEELHQRLKIHCAEQKTSIKDMIVKLINEELEQRKLKGRV